MTAGTAATVPLGTDDGARTVVLVTRKGRRTARVEFPCGTRERVGVRELEICPRGEWRIACEDWAKERASRTKGGAL